MTIGMSAHRNASHRHLLSNEVAATPAEVDAIIVPTARAVANLRSAVALARHHHCTLVAL